MRHVHRVVAIVAIIVGASIDGTLAREQSPPSVDDSLATVLTRIEQAQVDLVNGRPAPFKALWSHGDDVTLVGGLGGAVAKGWDEVSTRLDWVATQYADGRREHHEVTRVVSGDLAYVVQREVIRFVAPTDRRPVTQELRATMVVRREAGTWRIVHRHADAMVARQGQ